MKTPHAPPTPLLFYGTSAGGQAFDGDVQGGNPFATALIELTSDPGTRLGNLGARLRQRVALATQRRQVPEVPAQAWPDDWRFVQPFGAASESRLALVLVVSRYADPRVPPLYGAAHDERRVASMLAMHGFSVTQTVQPTRAGILKALAALSLGSTRHDAVLLYATAHGVEAASSTYLLPSDYPFDRGYAPDTLRRHAISVRRLTTAMRGSRTNLAFFAGCRSRVPPSV